MNPPIPEPPSDDLARDILARSAEKWIAEPLAQQWLMKARRDNRPRSAADVLGERFLTCAGFALFIEAGGDVSPTRNGFSMEDSSGVTTVLTSAQFALSVLPLALSASPYLWNIELMAEAERMTLPRHVVSRSVLPESFMWWSLSTGRGVAWGTQQTAGTLDSVFVMDQGLGIESICFASEGEWDDDKGRLVLLPNGVLYGAHYPDEVDETDHSAQLLQHLAFLNSPYIGTRTERLDRAARRRQKSPLANDTVRFIDLRRPETPRQVSGGDEHESSVQWKHRWLVSGHMRAQWYPSEQAHHVIYIPPYMKGPSEAPLIQHVSRVVR